MEVALVIVFSGVVMVSVAMLVASRSPVTGLNEALSNRIKNSIELIKRHKNLTFSFSKIE
jgi:hypothetical protein